MPVQKQGKVTLLRVHDLGTRYGPPTDEIDAEVVIWLSTTQAQNEAYGFQLRNDNNGPSRKGMLNILRDAFNLNWTVTTDVDLPDGKKNGIIRRVWITK
jgi:hypothetical protein